MSLGANRFARPRVQGKGAAGQGRIPLTAERSAMLAKVHIARKQLALGEDAYRDLLERVTGVRSAAQASDARLHVLIGELGRLGFKASRRVRRSDKPQVRMIYGLWGDLRPYVNAPSDDALRAFVRRLTRTVLHPEGVAAPEFLDAAQCNVVIEALKSWLARAQRAAEADAGERA